MDFYHNDFYSDLPDFELKVFAGEECEEDDVENPWFSWSGGCNDEGLVSSCRELSYSMRSFRIIRNTSFRASGHERICNVAAERGTSARVGTGLLAAIIPGVVVASIMLTR